MIKILYNPQSLNGDLAKFLLRSLFGGLMTYHGTSKLISFDEFLSYFPNLIGIGSYLSLILVIFAELICGLLVVVGALTRLAILPILTTMMVAFFLAHASDPFHLKELSFTFLGLSVIVFILGSGNSSLDHWLHIQGSKK